MKTYILTFVVLLSAAVSGYAQELRFSRAQIDSIIAQAAVTYESPNIDSIRLEGTVEDLAARFKEKGWTNPFSRFPERELEKAGFPKRTRYSNGVLLEGVCLDRKARLILYPISPENREVAYAALMFSSDEKTIGQFIINDVMPLVHRYEGKYGEFSVCDLNERFEKCGWDATREEYGSMQHIVTFEFEAPEVILRSQTGPDGSFVVVVHYVNKINLATHFLETPRDYHHHPRRPRR